MTDQIDVSALKDAATGRQIRVITPQLAGGGEGAIYRLHSPSGRVLKAYFPSVIAKGGTLLEPKLTAMVHSPPVNPTAALGHVSLAWPKQVIVTRRGAFAGYTMPEVDTDTSVELHAAANPADRKRAGGKTVFLRGFTWEYLVRIAANLAAATDALHAAGYVIGDFNERNILVHDTALVTVVDCDSMQVPAAPGEAPLLCRVYRPEFTAPELVGQDFSTLVRKPSSDLFALAVHIYQLLLEGRHPFTGVWHGVGEKPQRHELAQRGIFAQTGKTMTPTVGSPPYTILPPDVRELFRRAFEAGARDPGARPTAREWQTALNTLASSLKKCAKNPDHRYGGHLSACPWCALAPSTPTVVTTPQQPLPRAQPTSPVTTAPAPPRTTTPTPAAATSPVPTTVRAPSWGVRLRHALQPKPDHRRRRWNARGSVILLGVTAASAYGLGTQWWAKKIHQVPLMFGRAKLVDIDPVTFLMPQLLAGCVPGLILLGLFLARPPWRSDLRITAIGVVLLVAAPIAWTQAPGMAARGYAKEKAEFYHNTLPIKQVPNRCPVLPYWSWKLGAGKARTGWRAVVVTTAGQCARIEAFRGWQPAWSRPAGRKSYFNAFGMYGTVAVLNVIQNGGPNTTIGLSRVTGRRIWWFRCPGSKTDHTKGAQVSLQGLPGAPPGPALASGRTSYVVVYCNSARTYDLNPANGRPS